MSRESGAALITAERLRQIVCEGWTPEHDEGYVRDDLALAAVCYAMPAELRTSTFHYKSRAATEPETFSLPTHWPWARCFWKPTPDDRIRELVKAGALIAAEIDRLSL